MQNGTSGRDLIDCNLEDHLGDSAERACGCRQIVHVQKVASGDSDELLLAETEQPEPDVRWSCFRRAFDRRALPSGPSRSLKASASSSPRRDISSGLWATASPRVLLDPEKQAEPSSGFGRLAECRDEPRAVVRVQGEVAQPE